MKTIKTLTAQEFADGLREFFNDGIIQDDVFSIVIANLDKYLEKITPKPIYRNVIGEEFFEEGERCWIVDTKGFEIWSSYFNSNFKYDKIIPFLTYESAKKWFIENRPKFSIQDVTDLLNNLQLSPDQIQQSIKTLNK